MLTSAKRSRTGRSILEAAIGQAINHFQDLWLAGGFLAAEGEETDLVLVQIDHTADQAVGPDLAERPGLAQQDDRAVGIAPPQVNHPAAWSLLQIQLPTRGERPAVRGGLDPRRPLLEHGSDVRGGRPLQVRQVGMLEARPNLGLPPAVVALDQGLEAG